MKFRSYSIHQQSCWSEIPTGKFTLAWFDIGNCSPGSAALDITATTGQPKTSAQALVVNLIVPSGSTFDGNLPPPSASPSHSSNTHAIKIIIGVVAPVAAVLAFIVGILLIRCYRRKMLSRTTHLDQRSGASNVEVGHSTEKLEFDEKDSQQSDPATARPTEPQIFERRQQVRSTRFTQLVMSEVQSPVTGPSRQAPHIRYIPQPPTIYPGNS